MKDENKGRPILEFVGLRPKMYSILDADGTEKKKAKGIAKRTTSSMKHAEYLSSLDGETTTTATMQRITSDKQNVYTVEVTKIALSPYDDKRFVLQDKVTTLAYGHYKIGDLH